MDVAGDLGAHGPRDFSSVIADHEVRAELAAILQSPAFANAPSLSRFLTHIVDRTLSGRTGELKEYALGVDVFQRGESFDPKLDTIVRVQARRLRTKLQEYYASDGRRAPVVIELAKGRYVPSFSRRAGRLEAPPSSQARSSRRLFGLIAGAAALLSLIPAVWLWPKSGTGPVTRPPEYAQLTDFTDSATAPALSPDGRTVTFIRGADAFLSRGEVYVKVLPDGDAIRLTHSGGPKLSPVFTPDGSRVAYTEVSDKDWDTWTVPVLGGDPSRLLPNASGLVWLDRDHVMFSEFDGKRPHLGIVTASEARAGERAIYFPAHERGMAHYSFLSPDRQSVLVVEMDRTGTFQSCRLVPFDGRTSGTLVGPEGHCRSAAWSPDGTWMYFGAEVAGHSHLWRQRYPSGQVEQITFGPTEEEGVTVAPDGRSLITSIGTRSSAIWVHENGRDRLVSSEGYAYAPRLSRDGRRAYYLRRASSDSPSSELCSLDLASGRVERLLPGMAVVENDISGSNYDISGDEGEVVFASRDATGNSGIWLARLDRRTPPRELARDGAYPSFGVSDDVFFVSLGRETSYFTRMKKDGTAREQVSDISPIVNRSGISPDGAWAVLFSTGGTFAVPIRGGQPKRICARLCWVSWSSDQRSMYVASGGRTLVIPLAPGATIPNLREAALDELPGQMASAGTRVIEQWHAVPGPDPSTYTFVRTDFHRNLYRVPLH